VYTLSVHLFRALPKFLFPFHLSLLFNIGFAIVTMESLQTVGSLGYWLLRDTSVSEEHDASIFMAELSVVSIHNANGDNRFPRNTGIRLQYYTVSQSRRLKFGRIVQYVARLRILFWELKPSEVQWHECVPHTLCSLPTECIYLFHKILTINSYYFPKQY
jgi:hypothetical protein